MIKREGNASPEVPYISRCIVCKRKGAKEGIYIWETARTVFERM